MTAKEVTELLRQRYSPPEWAFFSELRMGTGYNRIRHNLLKNPEQRLDGWVLNCYPSKGLKSLAFEIKVSRQDFLNEIAQPDKRQQAIAVSNEFYFVIPDGVVDKAEIPEECGLMLVQDKTLRIVKKPVSNSEPLLNWHFVASIARRSGEVSQKTYREEKQHVSRLLRRIAQLEKEKIKLRNKVRECQAKEGKITEWVYKKQ